MVATASGALASLGSTSATSKDAELEQLRAWLNKPSATAAETLPIFQELQNRNEFYQAYLPKEQASMASLIELSLALTWSQRQR